MGALGSSEVEAGEPELETYSARWWPRIVVLEAQKGSWELELEVPPAPPPGS